jgi:MFS family permease
MAATPKLDREILVLGAVVLVGMLLAILDATIVNVAIPTLGRDLHASVSTIQWVMTAYLLAFASAIPVTGWASERFGAKPVWITALLIFLAGSALSGLAWSIDALIASRVIQGIGAGLLMPLRPLRTSSSRRRSRTPSSTGTRRASTSASAASATR